VKTMRTKRVSQFVLGWVLSLGVLGCHNNRHSAGDTRGEAPVIAPEAVVGEIGEGLRDLLATDKADEVRGLTAPVITLDAEDLEYGSVNDDKLIFYGGALAIRQPTDRVRSLREGDIVTSDAGLYPFVRRIVEVVGDTDDVVLLTEDVALGEVISDAIIRKSIDLKVQEKDFSGTVLAQQGPAKIVCASCYIRLTPKFDFGLRLTGGWLDSFLGSFTGTLEGKLQVLAEVDGSTVLSREVEVFSHSQRFAQAIGDIPIWEDVGVSVLVGVEGKFDANAKVRSGISASKSLEAELGLENGQWTFHSASPHSFTFEKVEISSALGANARVYVKTRVEVRIYSVLTAWLSGNASGEVGMRLCPAPATWTGKGLLSLTAGASVELNLVGYSKSVEKPIFEKEYYRTGPLASPIACP